MIPKTTTLLVLISFFVFSVNLYGQKKIEKSKEELTEQSGVNYQNSSSSSSSRNDNSSSSSGGESWFAEVFVEVLFGATVGVFKYGIIGDYTTEDHLYNNLSHYPYKDGSYGNFNSGDTLVKSKIRIDIEDSFLYGNKNLVGNHFKAKIRPFQYFYLQTDFRQIFEFDPINDRNYKLYFSHFTLGYDRIRMNKFNLGWNLGVSYIGNDIRKTGFTYGISTDYFLDKNISFSGSAKWSKINTRPVNAFELQGKYHKKNYFFSLGLEHLKIATPTYNFVTLGAGIYF